MWQTDTSACYQHLVSSTDAYTCYLHLVSSTDAIDISACYHHLVSSTDAYTSVESDKFDRCDRHIYILLFRQMRQTHLHLVSLTHRHAIIMISSSSDVDRHIDKLSSSCDFNRHKGMLPWYHQRLRSTDTPTIYHHAIIILWFQQTQRNANMMHHHLVIRVSEFIGHVDMLSSSFEFDSHVASKISRVHNHLRNKESWACVSTHIWAIQIRRIENDLKRMYQPSPTVSTHVCSIR